MFAENFCNGQSINAFLFISDVGATSQYKNIFIAGISRFFCLSEFHHLVVDLVNTVYDVALEVKRP